MKIPCQHIFAMREHQGEPLYCPELIEPWWTLDFYRQFRPNIGTSVRTTTVTQGTPRRPPLTENKKYNTIAIITQQINVLISRCGMEEFTSKKARLEHILDLWKQDKEWVVTEVLNANENTQDTSDTLPEITPHEDEDTSDTLPEITQHEDEDTSDTLPEFTQQEDEDTSDTLPEITQHEDEDTSDTPRIHTARR